VRELFLEYLLWANERLNAEYGIDFDVVSMVEEDMAHLEIFSPPEGRLLLALEGTEAAGLACMRRIRRDIGEIKRMYVRPEFRGRGIGCRLVNSLIQEARTIGYPRVRLDSTRFMEEAHSLYRSVGFKEIEEYPERENPEEYRKHWVFMEMNLQDPFGRHDSGVRRPFECSWRALGHQSDGERQASYRTSADSPGTPWRTRSIADLHRCH
jgi:GNAT superfamily N-acetyltransferase